MFKTWQIFVFSLVPLALVLAGVVIGSIHFEGGDSEREILPTAAPPAANVPPPTPVPGATVLQLVARNLQFQPRSLTATANQPVQLQFDNQDSGVPHNVAFFTNSSKTTAIYKTPLETGPKVETFTFTAPGPGTYFFVCEVHPDMTGSFVVR